MSAGRSYEDLYGAAIEQMVYAEELGFDSIWICEHHFTADGESTSPLLVASAIASKTKTVQIGTNLVVLPLRHPIRLAEEVATTSILANGRFILGIGAGYVDKEFEVFGRKIRERPSLMEEGVAVLRHSWSGQPFSFTGKRWSFHDVLVRPFPQARGVPLFIGGFTEPAIARAARIGDGFLCAFPAALPVYLNALGEAGKDPGAAKIAINQWAIIDSDPERTWDRIGQYALYQLNGFVDSGIVGAVPRYTDTQDIIARGTYALWDGPAAVRELRSLVDGCPQIVDIQLSAQLPGEPVSSGTERVEYIASHVLPALREAYGQDR